MVVWGKIRGWYMFYRMRILTFTILTSCITITRNIIPAAPEAWPKGVIFYKIDESLPEKTKENIIEAMQVWQNMTKTIVFAERIDQRDYAVFVDTDGTCSSYIGVFGGEQQVNLAKGCGFGGALHEIGHLIGLTHEHQRPDRDEYITIDWNQLELNSTTIFNFMSYPRSSFPEYLGPYDYASIMHYDAWDFSSTGKPTIIFPAETKKDYLFRFITDLDIKKVIMLYKKENPKVLIESVR